MHIRLMRNIEHEFVIGRIKHIMKGHRCFNHAEIRTDMPPVNHKFFNKGLT